MLTAGHEIVGTLPYFDIILRHRCYEQRTKREFAVQSRNSMLRYCVPAVVWLRSRKETLFPSFGSLRDR